MLWIQPLAAPDFSCLSVPPVPLFRRPLLAQRQRRSSETPSPSYWGLFFSGIPVTLSKFPLGLQARQSPPDLCGRGAATILPQACPSSRLPVGPQSGPNAPPAPGWEGGTPGTAAQGAAAARRPCSCDRPHPPPWSSPGDPGRLPTRHRGGSVAEVTYGGGTRCHSARPIFDAFCGGWSVGLAALAEAAQPGGWARMLRSRSAGSGRVGNTEGEATRAGRHWSRLLWRPMAEAAGILQTAWRDKIDREGG